MLRTQVYKSPLYWHELEAALVAVEVTNKANAVVRDVFKCMTCGTAAFTPNDRCKAHISAADALQTEREQHNAWRKRAGEAELQVEAQAAELARLSEALQHIHDGDTTCRCDHTTIECCAKVGEFCAHCLADKALKGGR